MAIGGGLVVIGSFMPWASVTSIFGTISIAGTQGDGKITLVLGLIIVVLAILELSGTAGGIRWVTLIFGFLAAGAGVLDMTNVSSRLGEAASDVVQPAVGVGLYAVVAGGVAVIAGGFLKR